MLAVTEWINEFKPVFDPIKYAIGMKAKDNNSSNKSFKDRQVKDLVHLNNLKLQHRKHIGNSTATFIEMWGIDKTIEPYTGYECAFVRYMQESQLMVEAIEKPIVNNSLQLEGRIDMVGIDINNVRYIIDFKTTKNLITTYKKLTEPFNSIKNNSLAIASLQVHTYNILSFNSTDVKVLIVQLKPDGTYIIHTPLDIRDLVIDALKLRYKNLIALK